MVFQPNTYSVLLVSASEKFNQATMGLLPVSEYWPVTVVKSVSGARQKLLETDFDLVLVNAPLPDDFGLELAENVCQNTQSGVLLLVKRELAEEIHERAVGFGVITLAKPTNGQMLSQSLRCFAPSESVCGWRVKSRPAWRKRCVSYGW